MRSIRANHGKLIKDFHKHMKTAQYTNVVHAEQITENIRKLFTLKTYNAMRSLCELQKKYTVVLFAVIIFEKVLFVNCLLVNNNTNGSWKESCVN